MTINQIKQAVGVESLMLVRQKDDTGVMQPWVSHWDNDKRIRVTMHDDVLKQLNSNTSRTDLAFKKQVISAKIEDGKEVRAGYTRYVVILPANIEACF